jgi:hypothetical protein
VNTGLGPRHNHPNRGLDVYKLLGMGGRLVDENRQPTVTAQNADDPRVQQFRARKFRYENPQTQEVFQSLGQ